MYRRHHDRGDELDRVRPDPPPLRSSADPVLALQRTIGNRSTAQLLARQTAKDRGSFEHSVKFGKHGPIEITGGNIAEWAAKKVPDDLKVISVKGKHSAELKRLFESKAPIDTVETASVVGENTLVTITFKSCRIRRYSADDEKEEWTLEFEAVKRHTVSIGAPR